jgi:hypothetical protein
MARPDDDRGGGCCGLHSRLSMRDRYPNGREKGAELSLRVNRIRAEQTPCQRLHRDGYAACSVQRFPKHTGNNVTSRKEKSWRHETSGFQRSTDIAPALKPLAIAKRSLYLP